MPKKDNVPRGLETGFYVGEKILGKCEYAETFQAGAATACNRVCFWCLVFFFYIKKVAKNYEIESAKRLIWRNSLEIVQKGGGLFTNWLLIQII